MFSLDKLDCVKLTLPVLEPDLYNPHVQPGLRAQLFSHVARGLGALVIRALQRLQLLGRDRGPWALAGVIQPVVTETLCGADKWGIGYVTRINNKYYVCDFMLVKRRVYDLFYQLLCK